MHGNPYIKTILHGTARVTSLSTWGHTVSACCADDTMKIWDLDNRRCLTEARLPSYPHALVQLGPDAAVVACDSQVCQRSGSASLRKHVFTATMVFKCPLTDYVVFAAATSSWFCTAIIGPVAGVWLLHVLAAGTCRPLGLSYGIRLIRSRPCWRLGAQACCFDCLSSPWVEA